jgi:fatty-acyl-CoA synthase
VQVVSEDGEVRPPAEFDSAGRLVNAEDCVGEMVNTDGAGPFEGYYKNDEAYRKATRNGWYWSGDLGYKDADGYLYFAGRTADWVRVDGENFPAGPIENALLRHPDVVAAAVYGVPDTQAGDQAMACVLLRDGTSFDGAAFAAWLDAQEDLGPKWRPRYVRVTAEMPTTGTNKIVKRQLAREKFRRDLIGADALYVRERDAAAYRSFGPDDEAAIRDGLVATGRERFWDL